MASEALIRKAPTEVRAERVAYKRRREPDSRANAKRPRIATKEKVEANVDASVQTCEDGNAACWTQFPCRRPQSVNSETASERTVFSPPVGMAFRYRSPNSEVRSSDLSSSDGRDTPASQITNFSSIAEQTSTLAIATPPPIPETPFFVLFQN